MVASTAIACVEANQGELTSRKQKRANGKPTVKVVPPTKRKREKKEEEEKEEADQSHVDLYSTLR